MKKELKAISAKNDLDFYYNAENQPNQDLVFGTLEYFETGKRKGFFEPLEFMNLLWEQYNFVNNNIQKSHTTITTLKALPLTVEQKHVLFGFILKWFGGYPIDNMNKQYDTTLRLIEKEFLSYNKQTPEKQFCQKDWEQYSRLKQIEGIMNDKINGKGQNTEYDFVSVKEHLKALPDLKAQIKFLTEIKTEYQQNRTGWEIAIGTPFDQQCELEINKLDKIFKLEQSTPTKAKPQLGGYTNSQLVLIFYYFFKQNGLEPRVSIDISPMAKFIHLITGREFKGVTSSDFYKKLQTVPNFKSDKELINDLEAIKPLFKMVQLNEVVKMIENEIDLARNEIKQAKKK
jgi:hypothetical protein